MIDQGAIDILKSVIYNYGVNELFDNVTAKYSNIEMSSFCANLDAYLRKCKNHGITWAAFSGFLQTIPIREKHITETKCPQQTQAFREIIEKMYQTHLEKNADYSPMNILGTGIVGICTRIWDKTARILSLIGYNLSTGEYSSERKSAKDESIEDNLSDLAVYAIIGLIHRKGCWGK